MVMLPDDCGCFCNECMYRDAESESTGLDCFAHWQGDRVDSALDWNAAALGYSSPGTRLAQECIESPNMFHTNYCGRIEKDN